MKRKGKERKLKELDELPHLQRTQALYIYVAASISILLFLLLNYEKLIFIPQTAIKLGPNGNNDINKCFREGYFYFTYKTYLKGLFLVNLSI
jgi:hypothetical protein